MISSVHEWALADAVVEAIRGALGDKPPSSLESAETLVGELQAADPEIFRFALNTLLADHGIARGKVHISTEKAEMRCHACGRLWNLWSDPGLDAEGREAIHFLPESIHAFVRCPGCGSADYSIEKGRGIRLGRILVTGSGRSGA
jgi:hydrogenase nickel incorporation protein HypA/HybF